MSNSISILRACLHAAVLVTLVLAGCVDETDSPVEPAVDFIGPALAPVFSRAGTIPRPGERLFVELAANDPTFAGFFIDGDELVVLAGSGAVGSTGVGGDGGGPGDLITGGGVGPTGSTGVGGVGTGTLLDLVSGTTGHDVSSVSYRTVEYSFLQLSEWRELIRPAVWASDDATGLDLDEARNRLTVSLRTGVGESEIRAAVQLLGVPEDVLYFEIRGTITAAAGPGDRARPVRGGYRIASRLDTLCSYGFNAMLDGNIVMVTASHCTETAFEVDNDSVWQNTIAASNFIGKEHKDPPGSTCGSYPCRASDAAAIDLVLSPDSIGLYQIARTTFRREGTASEGSRTIDASDPYFTIENESHYPVMGMELNKIGQTTGWTYGNVVTTCEEVPVTDDLDPETDYIVTCGYEIDARAGPGDSGAPVFYWDTAEDEIWLTGIVFGGNPTAWFSPMSSIEDDLGILDTVDPATIDSLSSVVIQGPDEVKPDQDTEECIWFASITGGYGTVSYQWERDGVNVGTNSAYYSDDTGEEDFELEVTASDLVASVEDALSVTVGSGSPGCS